MSRLSIRNFTFSKKNKYNAIKIKVDGYTFASKKEANRYITLMALQKLGTVKYFIRQPMFDLGAGLTYKADFLVFWTDGYVSFEDVKGFQTKEFKLKKKLVEAKYPVDIKIL